MTGREKRKPMEEKFDLQTALDLLQGRMQPEQPKKKKGSFLFQVIVAAAAAFLLWKLVEVLKDKRPLLPGRNKNNGSNNTGTNKTGTNNSGQRNNNGTNTVQKSRTTYVVQKPSNNEHSTLKNCGCLPARASAPENREKLLSDVKKDTVARTIEDLKGNNTSGIKESILKPDDLTKLCNSSSSIHEWTNHNLKPLDKKLRNLKLNGGRTQY